MSEQRNPNTKAGFSIITGIHFFSPENQYLIDADRAIADSLDQIIDELGDGLSEDTREEFTRAKLCELCFTALVDDYKK